jgi:hypothetical protein
LRFLEITLCVSHQWLAKELKRNLELCCIDGCLQRLISTVDQITQDPSGADASLVKLEEVADRIRNYIISHIVV